MVFRLANDHVLPNPGNGLPSPCNAALAHLLRPNFTTRPFQEEAGLRHLFAEAKSERGADTLVLAKVMYEYLTSLN